MPAGHKELWRPAAVNILFVSQIMICYDQSKHLFCILRDIDKKVLKFTISYLVDQQIRKYIKCKIVSVINGGCQ